MVERNTCQACCGNGEVVTDWDLYLHPPSGAPADAGVEECRDCEGCGFVDDRGRPAHEPENI